MLGAFLGDLRSHLESLLIAIKPLAIHPKFFTF